MKNWKTTVGGLITAIGLYMMTIPEVKDLGGVVAAIGAVFTGSMAKDSNVTGGSVKQ
jgi:hypothetical protein